jgi:hypothetical protein
MSFDSIFIDSWLSYGCIRHLISGRLGSGFLGYEGGQITVYWTL